MTKAEYLLRAQHGNAEREVSESINGEERVPSPVPNAKPREKLPLAVRPDRTPSPSRALGVNEHHGTTDSPRKSGKITVCKKKKKCLSDIFGHIVGGSKESTAAGIIADRSHTTEDPKDSPYADLDSVPILHRPKRTAVSPVQDVGRLLKEERRSPKAKTKPTEKAAVSSSRVSTSGSVDVNTGESKKPSCSSADERPVNFPASCRLMTRALKAEEDTDLSDALAASHMSTAAHADNVPHDTSSGAPIKTETSPGWDGAAAASSSSANHSSPKRRARKPDKKHVRNGSLAQSKCVDTSMSVDQPVKVKTETVVQDVAASYLSSPSPVAAFQDVKELMFKSLSDEESGGSALSVFRPDSNYKFSTFLMLLKDIHDTREKEGKPLTLPPSPVLIKEEPLVIPTAAGGHMLNGSCDGFAQGIKTEKGLSEKSTTAHNKAVKTKNRSKPIMTADTYYCKEPSGHSRIGSSDKQRRKQRLPAKLKLGRSGLSADLSDLAYGREFVSGHADLAGSSVTTDPTVSYLNKNPETTVAPKKRWQLLEESAENKEEGIREVPAEINGLYHPGTSEELVVGLAKRASDKNDSRSSAGRTQTVATKFLHCNVEMVEGMICVL